MIHLYVAGPCRAASQGEEFANIEAAESMGVELVKKGYSVFTPHTMMRDWDKMGLNQEQIMSVCLEHLRRCDGMILLEGWEDSDGSNRERYFAIMMQKVNPEFGIFYEGQEDPARVPTQRPKHPMA